MWSYELCIYPIATIVIPWILLSKGNMYCHEFVLWGVGFVSWGNFVIMSLYGLHSWIMGCKVGWGMEMLGRM